MSILKPLQLIFSFEGFINGVNSHDDIIRSSCPQSYDLSNFEERVHNELAKLKGLGLGGIVVNYGWNDYLDGDEGWQRFIAGIRAAAEVGLRIWIFDEKGFPSGTADGKVLAGHPELEAIGMKKMTVKILKNPVSITIPDPRAVMFAACAIQGNGLRQMLPITKEDRSIKLPDGNFSAVEVYFVAPLYEGTLAAANMSRARRYINVLNRKAVNRFLQMTHVRYFERIPSDLRQHIDAFFSDECSLMAGVTCNTIGPVQEDPVDTKMPQFPSVPWCSEMEIEFFNEHGYALQEHIPALFAGQEEHARKVRRDFWCTVSRLYASAFPEQSSDICAALGFDYTGHLLAEETILQQMVLHGDALHVLKQFHRPGIDLLTCRLDLFDNHLLTHKTALSASFFGSRKGVMSETSDYFECWSGDGAGGAPVSDIKCILALQYLLGVRDFCFMFLVPRFAPEDYREICAFTNRMLVIGKDRNYSPEIALYYPIEYVWERYTPFVSADNKLLDELCCAGIYGKRVNLQSEELDAICRLTTETVQQFFHSNVQYVLCERRDIARLPDRGIKTLVYYGPDNPDQDLIRICREAGVSIITKSDFGKEHQKQTPYRTGSNIVYATYGGFVFAINRGRETSFISFPGQAEAVFPMKGLERHNVCGKIDIEPFECVFLCASGA